jgi:exopolyphosphatase/guanosine-5'-triphosphate,3'-diphosphate pyrophosphatase
MLPIDAYLAEKVRTTVELLAAEIDLGSIHTLVFAGADPRYLAPDVGKKLNDDCWIIGRDDFIQAVEHIRQLGVAECRRRYGLTSADEAGFIVGNLVYRLFLERTTAEEVLVPFTSIREGMLVDLSMGVDAQLMAEFSRQIVASAVNLGRRYHFDEKHSLHVARLSLILFDALKKEHGMGERERMMLEVAAILHDIGMFIRGGGHQKHGQYIVAHSEIFGLRPEEQAVIANVVGCHRGPMPDENDYDYIALQREERTTVLKMASLLRVADSLDRSHSQRIKNLSVEKHGETFLLHSGLLYDLSTERLSLEEKGQMFQEVFGYKVEVE